MENNVPDISGDDKNPVYQKFSKNDFINLSITDIAEDGAGVGKYNGIAVFVPSAVPGDFISAVITSVKKNYCKAEIIKIITKSPFRIDTDCVVFGKCGGCSLLNFDYNEELNFKENKIKECFKRIAMMDNIKIESILKSGQLSHYRNKATYQVTEENGEYKIGFYSLKSYDVIENEFCHVCNKENGKIINTIRRSLKKHGIPAYDHKTKKGVLRNIVIRNFGGETVVCFVINGTSLKNAYEISNDIVKNTSVRNVIVNSGVEGTGKVFGNKTNVITGNDYLSETIDGIKYHISITSFFQVNTLAAKLLYESVIQYSALKGNETAVDLYCGIGSISLMLSKRCKKVYGIDNFKRSISDAKLNAHLNNIDNVEFITGKAEDKLSEIFEKEDGIDLAVLDPPRSGCDKKLLEQIAFYKIERVVYVSCNAATMARDVKRLADLGYSVVSAQPVDMFPRTFHVETVVLMSRVEG